MFASDSPNDLIRFAAQCLDESKDIFGEEMFIKCKVGKEQVAGEYRSLIQGTEYYVSLESVDQPPESSRNLDSFRRRCIYVYTMTDIAFLGKRCNLQNQHI